MNRFLSILLFIVSLSAALQAQVTIEINHPGNDEVLQSTSVQVQAILVKPADSTWASVKYRFDNEDLQNYQISDSCVNSIVFSTTQILADEREHIFYLQAELKGIGSIFSDSVVFKVLIPLEITEDSVSPGIISPNHSKLTITVNFNKNMDTTATAKPSFDFIHSDSTISTITDEGSWTDEKEFILETTSLINITGIDGAVNIKMKNTKSKLGTSAGELTLTSSFHLDTKSPAVFSVADEPSWGIHSEDAGALTLTITFNEDMDTTKTPEVEIFQGSTNVLFNTDPVWNDLRIFSVKNSADAGLGFTDNSKAGVRISGAFDAGGNQMAEDNTHQAFLFDHSPPQVEQAVSSHKAIHIKNPDEVTLIITFNEIMSDSYFPAVKAVYDTKDVVFSSGQWKTNKIFTVKNDGKIDQSFAPHDSVISVVVENAYDRAGNKLESKVIESVFIMDHKAPDLSSVESVNRTYVNRAAFGTLSLNFTFSEPVKPSIETYVQDSIKINLTSNSGISQTPVFDITTALDTSVVEGPLAFLFTNFEDSLGNKNTAYTKFENVVIVDNQPPSTVVVNEFIKSTNKDTISFSGNKNDNNGEVGIIINDIVRDVDSASSLWEYTYDISSLSDDGIITGKSYLFKFEAVDAAGNKSQSVTKNLVIDRTPPVSVQVSPNPFNTVYINKAQVTFGVINDSGEDAKFVFRETGINMDQPINNGCYIDSGSTVGGLIKSFHESVDGERVLQIYGIDTLGNRSGVLESFTFTLDRVEPKLSGVLVNNIVTANNNWVYIGVSEADEVELKFIFTEETSGINENSTPDITLIHEDGDNSITISGGGEWQEKTYTISLNQSIEKNYEYDGIYFINVKNVHDNAANISQLNKDFFVEIDTHAPVLPSITSLESLDIISRENVQTLKGQKDAQDIVRIIVEENLITGLIDSTNWTTSEIWELNLFFDESREYNFRIMSEDLAKNRSEPLLLRITIDWLPPFLSGVQPYLLVDMDEQGRESGFLYLFFSESLKKINAVPDSLYIYQKNTQNSSRIFADNIDINKNELKGQFNIEDISQLGEWVRNGIYPVFHFQENGVTDIADNGNIELDNVPFKIVSPTVIQEITDKNLYFSPNGDGVNDSLSVIINFTDSREKYLNFSVYDPLNYGTIFNLSNLKISKSDLPIIASDSTYRINGSDAGIIEFIWYGKNSFTHKIVNEGDYFVKFSGTINSNYSTQFPMILNAKVDLTSPKIKEVYPAFGNNQLKLSKGTLIKLFSSEPIYINQMNPGGDLIEVPYLSAGIEVGEILNTDSTSTFIKEDHFQMEIDSTDENMHFYFEIDSSFITMHGGSTKSMLLILEDKAGLSDTIQVRHVFFESSVEKGITDFVNFPNPFNPDNEFTTFQFSVSQDIAEISLRIFDVSGELVAYKEIPLDLSGGNYITERWNGTNLTGARLANGVYYAALCDGKSKSKIVKVMIFRY